MIKINKVDKVFKEKYKNEILRKLKNRYTKLNNKKLKGVELNPKYNEILKDIFENIDKILIEDIEIVIEIYTSLYKKYPQYLFDIKSSTLENNNEKILFNKYLSYIFNYEAMLSENDLLYELTQKINIEVCPYCNRNYITTVKKSKNKIRCDFDHFYPKSKFRILALSLCNLVPSCSVCNKIKKDKCFTVESNKYPYNEGIENIKYFTYELDEYEEYKVKYIKNKDIKMDLNMEMLLLDEMYKTHNIEIKELIRKKECIEECNNNFSNIKLENKKVLLGYTVDKSNLKNKSLSKFRNDIIDEIL